jgi:hypothetical protein
MTRARSGASRGFASKRSARTRDACATAIDRAHAAGPRTRCGAHAARRRVVRVESGRRRASGRADPPARESRRRVLHHRRHGSRAGAGGGRSARHRRPEPVVPRVPGAVSRSPPDRRSRRAGGPRGLDRGGRDHLLLARVPPGTGGLLRDLLLGQRGPVLYRSQEDDFRGLASGLRERAD